MGINLPPLTGDVVFDAWLKEVSDQFNSLAGAGGLGGGPVADSMDTPPVTTSVNTATLVLLARTTGATPSDLTIALNYNYLNGTLQNPNDTSATVFDGWEFGYPDFTEGTHLWAIRVHIAEEGTEELIQADAWSAPEQIGDAGVNGEDAVTPRVDSLMLPAGMTTAQVVSAYDTETLDFATFRNSTSGLQFRNDGGNTKVLMSTVRIGGNDASVAEHYTYTYEWTKNGLTFTPSVTGQNRNRRFIVINADDVADGGEDVFLCNVISA